MEQNIMKRGWQLVDGRGKKQFHAAEKQSFGNRKRPQLEQQRQQQHDKQQKRKINSILFEYTQINGVTNAAVQPVFGAEERKRAKPKQRDIQTKNRKQKKTTTTKWKKAYRQVFITALGTRLALHIYILKHGKTYTNLHAVQKTNTPEHTDTDSPPHSLICQLVHSHTHTHRPTM